MIVDYNKFSKTFANSRKSMQWEELNYFFSLFSGNHILDLGCGSGRLLDAYKSYFGVFPKNYLGIDLSQGLLKEAENNFPEHYFEQGNMCEVKKIVGERKFDSIFLIASLHHLESLEQRLALMQQLYSILLDGGKVYLTNWALDSQFNTKKYLSSRMSKSTNVFKTFDYNIKIGRFLRFYHCFSLKELEFISQESGFNILENRIFETDKNFITILQK